MDQSANLDLCSRVDEVTDPSHNGYSVPRQLKKQTVEALQSATTDYSLWTSGFEAWSDRRKYARTSRRKNTAECHHIAVSALDKDRKRYANAGIAHGCFHYCSAWHGSGEAVEDTIITDPSHSPDRD